VGAVVEPVAGAAGAVVVEAAEAGAGAGVFSGVTRCQMRIQLVNIMMGIETYHQELSIPRSPLSRQTTWYLAIIQYRFVHPVSREQIYCPSGTS